ncbi:MAG: transferase [Burkholderiales bacterium RIFCSPLOWO2_02_FULL_57_36]|nr:MAG: transferase [Burkholderiales bacterium RIFCSPLOWO2_02_FULL_57_36]
MNSPCKVLVVHNKYRQRGGEDVVVDAEVRLLRERGHRVETYSRDNDSIEDLPRTTVALDTLWSSRTMVELDRRIVAFKPDVIHIHNTFPLVSPSLYWAAARKNVPVVQTLHNYRLLCPQAMLLRNNHVCEDCLGHSPWRSVVRRCYRDSAVQSAVLAGMLVLHRAIGTYDYKVTRYIALNRFSRDKFVEGGLPADRISIKPNFVDIPERPQTARSGALFVGRLSAEKGVALLLQALDRLPGLDIDVVGTGPEMGQVDSHPRANGLGMRHSAEVMERMHRAAYLVMPSIWYETFALVVLEAFACGLPVIASRLGSMQEFIEDGRTGLLFQSGSAEDLAAKIAWAEGHPDEMARMGRNARAEYVAKYTPNRNYEQLMSIYESALSGRRMAQT